MADATNKLKMEAAVQGWIAGAQLRTPAEGARLLHAKAEWVADKLNELSACCASGRPVPALLEGLTAFDLADAREALSAAAGRLITAAAFAQLMEAA